MHDDGYIPAFHMEPAPISINGDFAILSRTASLGSA
jgi:hypothetical protein